MRFLRAIFYWITLYSPGPHVPHLNAYDLYLGGARLLLSQLLPYGRFLGYVVHGGRHVGRFVFEGFVK